VIIESNKRLFRDFPVVQSFLLYNDFLKGSFEDLHNGQV